MKITGAMVSFRIFVCMYIVLVSFFCFHLVLYEDTRRKKNTRSFLSTFFANKSNLEKIYIKFSVIIIIVL